MLPGCLQARETELTAQLRSLEEEARRAGEMAAQGGPLRATSPNVPHSPPAGMMADAGEQAGGSPMPAAIRLLAGLLVELKLCRG